MIVSFFSKLIHQFTLRVCGMVRDAHRMGYSGGLS